MEGTMPKLKAAVAILFLTALTVSAMDIIATLNSCVYYKDQFFFKDMMKHAKRWWVCSPNEGLVGNSALTDALVANPDAQLTNDRYPKEAPYNGYGYALNTIVEIWEGVFPFGEWTFEFEGDGDIVLKGLHSKKLTSSGAKVTYTFSLTKANVNFVTMGSGKRQPRNKENLKIGVIRSNKSNPIRNMKLFPPDVTKETADFQPFRNDFLSRLAHSPYTMVRFMNWANVNYSKEEKWSERTPKTKLYQTGGFRGIEPYGVAYEYMIELCNLTGKDMWLNIPSRADDDYINKLAELVYTKLDKDRKVWLEYANEVWNGMFVGYQWAVDKGRELNLGPVDKAWQHNNYYYTYRTVQIGETFKRVFGTDSNRITSMLCGWANGAAWSQKRIEALNDPKVNPNGYDIKYFATTTYFGAPGSVDQTMAPSGDWGTHIQLIQDNNMEWISYEGGHGGGMPENQLYS